MCDCVERVDAELIEAGGNMALDIPLILNREKNEWRGDRLCVSVLKRDNQNRKKPTRLLASYCPFCGEMYGKGQEENDANLEEEDD
mgnify:FL=1